MQDEGLIRLLILLLWVGNAAYLASALYSSRPSVYMTGFEDKPLAIAAQSALRKIVTVSLIGTTVITASYLYLSYHSALAPMEGEPGLVMIVGIARFVCFYAMSLLPGTFLWGHLRSLKVIDEAKYGRMLDVQRAAIEGRPPPRRRSTGEGA